MEALNLLHMTDVLNTSVIWVLLMNSKPIQFVIYEQRCTKRSRKEMLTNPQKSQLLHFQKRSTYYDLKGNCSYYYLWIQIHWKIWNLLAFIGLFSASHSVNILQPSCM